MRRSSLPRANNGKQPQEMEEETSTFIVVDEVSSYRSDNLRPTVRYFIAPRSASPPHGNAKTMLTFAMCLDLPLLKSIL